MSYRSEGFINGNPVAVEMGDITHAAVDAIIVPQFDSAASYGGVGGAVARNGAAKGMALYEAHIAEAGPLEFGTVFLTPSLGGPIPYLLHAVSVASGEDNEYKTVQNAMFNALTTASEMTDIQSIAAPALGTGIIGDLTDAQSAEAMMTAVSDYKATGGRDIAVTFVIFGSNKAFMAFSNVLKNESYTHAVDHQVGKRQFDLQRWVDNMVADEKANAPHDADQSDTLKPPTP